MFNLCEPVLCRGGGTDALEGLVASAVLLVEMSFPARDKLLEGVSTFVEGGFQLDVVVEATVGCWLCYFQGDAPYFDVCEFLSAFLYSMLF